MSDTPERDPLEDLLAPPGPIDAEALRQSVLAATTRRLRRRRWQRRVALAAALAACYAAGLLTMRLLAPAFPPQDIPAEVVREERPAPPPAPMVVAADPAAERRPDRAARLRQAGDRYLTEENDPEAALHAYSESLNAGSPDDSKFSPDDNWLLMAIKNAREKEARHANDDG
ncbi:MAG TPA: hypothetical protein VKA46_42915 [Gemmataceae bacterium]|nr:hypothetical protein [Gemmataceae bacterium]